MKVKQKIYWHNKGFKSLKSIFRNHAVQKILLLTGNKSFVKSGAQALLEPILKNYDVLIYSHFSPSPKIQEVNEGLKMQISFLPDIVIAVGGGSVIDFAKAIQYYLIHQGHIIVPPLIVIPTTSGAGSEATHFAVIYDHNKKLSLSHEALIPQYVFFNSLLTESQSSYQTAVSGVDALCQSIESLWNRNSTKLSKYYASKALKLLVKNLPLAVHHPNTEGVRKAMMQGAYWAGKAINITKTTAPHAFSYTLTSHFGIPHGQAVAVFLPTFLVYNADITEQDCLDERGVAYVRKSLKNIYRHLGCQSKIEAIDFIEAFFQHIGLKSCVQALDIAYPNLQELIFSTVNIERLSNNPRRIDKAKIIL